MIDSSFLNRIIEISLIGLGLLIGLYAIIMDRLEDLLKTKIKEINSLKNKRDAIFDKLNKNREDNKLREEYIGLEREIEQLSKSPYHYNFGYIISGIFFIITLIFPYYSLYIGYDKLNYSKIFVDKAPFFIFCGLINFIYIWVKTMIDFRNLTLKRFDEIQEEESKRRQTKTISMPYIYKSNLRKKEVPLKHLKEHLKR